LLHQTLFVRLEGGKLFGFGGHLGVEGVGAVGDSLEPIGGTTIVITSMMVMDNPGSTKPEGLADQPQRGEIRKPRASAAKPWVN